MTVHHTTATVLDLLHHIEHPLCQMSLEGALAQWRQSGCPDAPKSAGTTERIPPLLMQGLRAYRDDHRPVGRFLRAVLENDLSGALICADVGSTAALPDIWGWCHDELPGNAWGSRDEVDAWLAKGRERRSA